MKGFTSVMNFPKINQLLSKFMGNIFFYLFLCSHLIFFIFMNICGTKRDDDLKNFSSSHFSLLSHFPPRSLYLLCTSTRSTHTHTFVRIVRGTASLLMARRRTCNRDLRKKRSRLTDEGDRSSFSWNTASSWRPTPRGMLPPGATSYRTRATSFPPRDQCATTLHTY